MKVFRRLNEYATVNGKKGGNGCKAGAKSLFCNADVDERREKDVVGWEKLEEDQMKAGPERP